MARTVNQQIDAVIAREGGYSNHPADRGGPTRWGVTEQVARAHGYAGDMREYPRALAVEMYRRRYWNGPGIDKIADVSPALAEEMFDTGINMGPAVAVGLLQRALNVLNRGATDYPDITADGRVGPMTMQALRGYAAKRGGEGLRVLTRLVDCLQGERYVSIAEKRPANEAFVYGWISNRLGGLA